ncbi:hypothetical protein LNKW23_41920 [Paralimibaculum aggregatum]|uniref:Uncharacterized protein n=1 Tax=Paralimibaculum aggregatum TaxID=3036245 RepID=A0ABQ6LSD0_9RHOB|nr:hypothetical protein [Limibaculum sp. NKW23]GMG84976.1 hypothetical protein LNKW23_41920 [Limibaculum sp. NKW23]
MEPNRHDLPTVDESQARERAKASYQGQRLSNAQFEDAWAIAKIMRTEIKSSGSFTEKLTDYAHAFARSQRFDQLKGETIIRDIFKERYGQTMNQMREAQLEREGKLDDFARKEALNVARGVPELIQSGETMPFYKSYDIQATTFAEAFQISEATAKTVMKEAYKEAEGRDLYEAGKEVEERVHRPKVEAERRARETDRLKQSYGEASGPRRGYQRRYEP